MRKPVQLALPILLCLAIASHAQNSGATSSAATRAAAPAATTSPSPAQPAPTGRSARRGSNPAKRGEINSNAAPKSGTSITGVPGYRAGFRGSKSTPAATATADVSVTGGAGDTPTGINPKTATLPIPLFKNAFGVASGAIIHVRLLQPVDSGHAHNGDMLDGVLTAPLGSVPAGSPVKLTVVAAAAAGQMTSAGELSLQVVSIDGQTLLSNVITAEGEAGKTLQADGAPARGTEASFTADRPLELPAA